MAQFDQFTLQTGVDLRKPSVIKLDDGRLVAAWHNRDAGRIEVAHSFDDGVTFSAPRTISTAVDASPDDVVVFQVPAGTHKGKVIVAWNNAANSPAGQILSRYSDDNSITFNGSDIVIYDDNTDQGAPGPFELFQAHDDDIVCGFSVLHVLPATNEDLELARTADPTSNWPGALVTILVNSNVRPLFAKFGTQKIVTIHDRDTGTPNENVVAIQISTDDAATFGAEVDIYDPAGTGIEAHARGLIRLPDDRLIALITVNEDVSGQFDLKFMESADEGSTWGLPKLLLPDVLEGFGLGGMIIFPDGRIAFSEEAA